MSGPFSVLLADDEEIILKGLAEHVDFSGLGFAAPVLARDGREALIALGERAFDLLVTDICMPFADGLEVAEKAKAAARPPRVVFLTGHDEFAYAKRAIELGALRYVSKPVDVTAFEGLLRTVAADLAAEAAAAEEIAKLRRIAAAAGGYPNGSAVPAASFRSLPRPRAEDFSRSLAALDLDGCAAIAEAYLGELAAAGAPSAGASLAVAAGAFVDRMVAFALDSGIAPAEAFPPAGDPYAALAAAEGSASAAAWFRAALARLGSCLEGRYRGPALEYVRRAEAFIARSYADPSLKLEDVARAAICSPGYLSTVFKRVTGVSVVERVNRERIERAKALIKEGSLKLYEIAERVGFKDPHYFSTRFYDFVGTSPSDYKRMIDFDV